MRRLTNIKRRILKEDRKARIMMIISTGKGISLIDY